jgi:hypothetical protein
MLSRLQKAAIGLLPHHSSHSISLILLAYSKLPYHPVELVEALTKVSQDQLMAFEPRHIANTLYALASMKFLPDGTFLEALIQAARLQAHQFQPEEWANLTWALAKFTQHSASLRCLSWPICTGFNLCCLLPRCCP